jgi:hypothetical protein
MNLHAATSPDCPVCLGHGQVCDAHPDQAWGPGLPAGYFPYDRVCWCGADPRPCPGVVDDEIEPRASRRSYLWEVVIWALFAMAIRWWRAHGGS